MAGYRVKIKTGQDCESYVSSVTIYVRITTQICTKQ